MSEENPLKKLPMDIKIKIADAILPFLMSEEAYKTLCEMVKPLEEKLKKEDKKDERNKND